MFDKYEHWHSKNRTVPHLRRTNNFHESNERMCVRELWRQLRFSACVTQAASRLFLVLFCLVFFCWFWHSKNAQNRIRNCTYNARKRNGCINKSNWNIPFIRLYARLLLLYLVCVVAVAVV